MKNELNEEIQKRLEDPFWDEKIGRIIVSRMERKQRIQYASLGLAFSAILLVFFSFGMDINSDSELTDLQTVYTEMMGHSSLEGIEELISFLE